MPPAHYRPHRNPRGGPPQHRMQARERPNRGLTRRLAAFFRRFVHSWQCPDSGQAGNAIDFLVKIRGVTFNEAMLLLTRSAGS